MIYLYGVFHWGSFQAVFSSSVTVFCWSNCLRNFSWTQKIQTWRQCKVEGIKRKLNDAFKFLDDFHLFIEFSWTELRIYCLPWKQVCSKTSVFIFGVLMKVSNVKPWQQISKQKQQKPLKETCSKLKFGPMKPGPTNRATGVVNIFTTSAWIHDILSCMKRTSWSFHLTRVYFSHSPCLPCRLN